MKTSIFIVDDHYMVIEGIRSLLQHENDLEWLGHATSAASCLSFLQQELPDVIFMDVNLPDMSGIDLCREVRTKYPSVWILGLSTFNQQAVIRSMMEQGASGYVLKNATKKELQTAIAMVRTGRNYLSLEAAQSLREPQGEIPVITRREKEVLQLIAKGLTDTEIAEKLFVSNATVHTHRKSLIEKLEARNTASLIGIAMKAGLIP